MKITKKVIQDIAYTGESERDYLNVSLDKKQGHIEGIYVSDDNRRKGVGTALLRALIKDADKRGWTLTLQVSASDGRYGMTNTRLTRWYEQYGFVSTTKDKKIHPVMKRKPHVVLS